ncbi:MAG: twin-arginine translocation signal domain-containing protein [Anaerolineae bacterium]|nr:twin-arginine translocation signal domain-containing protein [Anaerolineae bacterium]
MPEDKNNHTEGLSRRELLKALAATGGAVAAATLLPEQWSSPAVQVGVLPAHAQISEPDLPVTIISCHMADVQGYPEIYNFSTIELHAIIRTERTDIEAIPLVMTLTVRRVESTGDELLTQDVGTATILPSNNLNEATFTSPNYDLSSHELGVGDMLMATWTFQNPEDSTDTCGRTSLIAQPN